MEAEDLKVLVNLQLEKAHRFLAQADEMYSMQYWDLAANRYYYACYHAVQALFIAKWSSCNEETFRYGHSI